MPQSSRVISFKFNTTIFATILSIVSTFIIHISRGRKKRKKCHFFMIKGKGGELTLYGQDNIWLPSTGFCFVLFICSLVLYAECFPNWKCFHKYQIHKMQNIFRRDRYRHKLNIAFLLERNRTAVCWITRRVVSLFQLKSKRIQSFVVAPRFVESFQSWFNTTNPNRTDIFEALVFYSMVLHLYYL